MVRGLPMSSKYLPHYAYYPADFRRDTRHLTREQRDAFRELMDEMWITGQRRLASIPDDDTYLSAVVGVSAAKWKEFRAVLVDGPKAVLTVRNGRIYQKRLSIELKRARTKSDKARAAATGKWGESDRPTDTTTRSGRLAAARRKGRHTAAEWGVLLGICGDACLRCDASGVRLVKDHITPIYQGGSDAIDNIQPICDRCSKQKGPESTDFRPADWRERLRNVCGSSATQNQTQNQTQRQKKTYGRPNRSPSGEKREKEPTTARARGKRAGPNGGATVSERAFLALSQKVRDLRTIPSFGLMEAEDPEAAALEFESVVGITPRKWDELRAKFEPATTTETTEGRVSEKDHESG